MLPENLHKSSRREQLIRWSILFLSLMLQEKSNMKDCWRSMKPSIKAGIREIMFVKLTFSLMYLKMSQCNKYIYIKYIDNYLDWSIQKRIITKMKHAFPFKVLLMVLNASCASSWCDAMATSTRYNDSKWLIRFRRHNLKDLPLSAGLAWIQRFKPTFT